jgi:hypothetical protein
MRKPLPARIAAVLVAVAVPSCAQVIGLDQYHDGICEPGTTSSDGCPYGGAEGTEGVGICKAAVRTCNEDGSGWGACKGEVTPKEEDCSTPLDENCDGHVNEKESGCCTAGESFSCYDGPADTEGVGACKAGTQACGDDGKTVGTCTGMVKPTQELCSDTIDNDCDHRECVEWAVSYGDVTLQLVQASAVDKDGNIYVGGFFEGTIALGQTVLTSAGVDAFLIKLDPAGKPLWGKSYTGSLNQTLTAIATDDQGNVVFGGSTMDTIDLGGGSLPAGVFAAKLGPNGDYIWSQSIAVKGTCTSSDSNLWSLAALSNGDVIAGGYYCGKLMVGDTPTTSNGRDAFILRLSASQGLATSAAGGWVKAFGDANMQEIQRVAVGPSDSIFVAGQFQGQMDFGKGAVTSGGDFDGIVIQLDATGKALQYDTIGGAGKQQIFDLAVDPQGGLAVTGTSDTTYANGGTSHPQGSFIIRYGANLSIGWNKSYPTGFPFVAIDSSNNVGVSGLYMGSIDLGDGQPLTPPSGSLGKFLCKYSGAGTLLWKRGYPVDQSAGAGSGAFPHFVSSGELVTVGGFGGTVDLGGLTVTSNGDIDILVAKFGL